MGAIRQTILIMLVLALGFSAGMIITSARAQGPTSGTLVQQVASVSPFYQVDPKDSPKDRVAENAIAVYGDRVVLDIKNAQWATFTDTHSMEPVISAGANALEVVPASADDIKVGDIVSYKSNYADGIIIHRVVYTGNDEQGKYFIMKGDNLPTSDPGKVRFSQIQRVVVAIIY